MFVPDKELNVACIHVLLPDKMEKRTLTVVMYYGVNACCVRESPDLCSDGMFVPHKK